MKRLKQLQVLFLGMVYFILLTAMFLPHHHHEEAACYTSTHCEENASDHDQHAEESESHHHDHNTSEESKHCLTYEYYVFSDASKTLKRAYGFRIEIPHHHHFHISSLVCDEKENETDAIAKRFRLLPSQNIYTTIIKYELPLRAPPALIV